MPIRLMKDGKIWFTISNEAPTAAKISFKAGDDLKVEPTSLVAGSNLHIEIPVENIEGITEIGETVKLKEIHLDIKEMKTSLGRFIETDKEFKQKLTLLLSQMYERQEISQEAFDKLNAPLQDFIAGDSADLDSF